MKNFLFLFSIAILLVCCDINQIPASYFKHQEQLLDSLGQRYWQANRFSGTILVAQQDTLLYHKDFGLADYEKQAPFSTNTAFKIGEVSHYFTSQIIRELDKEGIISLGDKMSDYLVELNTDFTIEQVLLNQAGLPQERLNEANTSIFQQINHIKLDSNNTAPSNLGYHLLGLLIEKASKMTFEEAIQEYLAAYDLKHTFYKQANTSLAQGYTGFNNKRGQGLERERVVSYQLVKMFSSRGIKASAKDVWKILQPLPAAYTFGFLANDGFSYCVSKKMDGQIIIVLSNYRHPVAEEMVKSIEAILHKQAFDLPLLRLPIDINKNLLPDYKGTYEINPSFTFEVTSTADSLYVSLFGQTSSLIPQATDQFFLVDSDASMRFVRDANQQVSGVMLYDGFLEGTLAKKIK